MSGFHHFGHGGGGKAIDTSGLSLAGPDHIWEISQNTPLDDHLYVPEGAFATTHLALTS